MTNKISEWMDDFEEDGIVLQNACITTPELIQKLTMKRLAKARPPRRLLRTILAAAALILALTAGALAVYQHSMNQLSLQNQNMTETEESASGEPSESSGEENYDYTTLTTEQGVALKLYSAVGYSDTTEYQALNEWAAYYSSFAQKESFDESARLPDGSCYKDVYMMGYQEGADKLDEIAAKYGLRLIESLEYFLSQQAIWEALGTEPFFPWVGAPAGDGNTDGSGFVFSDGSLNLLLNYAASSMDFLSPTDTDVFSLHLYRGMKGSMPTQTVSYGEAADRYQCETRTLSSGVSADLALGTHESIIVAELDTCYILVMFRGGYDPEPYPYFDGSTAPLLDMDDLQTIAEALNIAALDNG